MKVLVIADAHAKDGAQGMLRMLTKYWHFDLGWHIDVLFPRKVGADDPIMLNFGMVPIGAISQGAHYDFAVVNTLLNLVFLDNLSGVPLYLWVHEGATLLWNSNIPIGKWMSCFSKAKGIVFQTAFQAECLFKTFISQREKNSVAIIPNGIEEVCVSFQPQRSDGIFRICWVGSVNGRKRPHDLIKAVDLLSDKHAVHVDFIGPLEDTPYMGEDFRAFINRPDVRFTWHGGLTHERTQQILSESNALCMTSSDESMPLVPLEAARLGVPVVLADLVVYNYIGWEDKNNCLKYPLGSVADLANSLEFLITKPDIRNMLSANAQSFSLRFDKHRFLASFTEFVSA